MIVLDASVVAEVLLETKRARYIVRRIRAGAQEMSAPHLIDIEVAHVIRRYARENEFEPTRGLQMLDDLAGFPIERYPHSDLLGRIWELRDNLTAYDAAYVALAEALDATLVTCDAKLFGARKRYRARVELL